MRTLTDVPHPLCPARMSCGCQGRHRRSEAQPTPPFFYTHIDGVAGDASMSKSETPRRHTPAPKNGNGNGRGKGNGGGAAAAAAQAPASPRRPREEDVIATQPPITELLRQSGGRMKGGVDGGLQKTKLLEA